jgi:hypothetical protein
MQAGFSMTCGGSSLVCIPHKYNHRYEALAGHPRLTILPRLLDYMHGSF